MCLECVLLVRGAETDDIANEDDRGLVFHTLGRAQSAVEGVEVIAVAHPLHLPAVGGKTQPHVLGKIQRGRPGQRDLVVVVQHDQLAQSQMPGQRASFGSHPLHQVAVRGDDVGMVIDNLVAGSVVSGRQVRLADSQAHRV